MPTSNPNSSSISVVTGRAANVCRPFTVEFRLAAPEAGFKIMVIVEKGCSPEAEPILKLVFDLYKKIDNEFVEIVHVSFTAGTEDEKQGILNIASDGMPRKSARMIREKVYPIAKKIENRQPTAKEKADLKDGMRNAAVTAVEV
jgi:hypothetical protein